MMLKLYLALWIDLAGLHHEASSEAAIFVLAEVSPLITWCARITEKKLPLLIIRQLIKSAKIELRILDGPPHRIGPVDNCLTCAFLQILIQRFRVVKLEIAHDAGIMQIVGKLLHK